MHGQIPKYTNAEYRAAAGLVTLLCRCLDSDLNIVHMPFPGTIHDQPAEVVEILTSLRFAMGSRRERLLAKK